jgi:hypothetical protein
MATERLAQPLNGPIERRKCDDRLPGRAARLMFFPEYWIEGVMTKSESASDEFIWRVQGGEVSLVAQGKVPDAADCRYTFGFDIRLRISTRLHLFLSE